MAFKLFDLSNLFEILRAVHNIQQMHTNTVWFCLYEAPRIVKFIELESPLVDARDEWVGSGRGELVLNGDRISVEEGEEFGRWTMVRVAQQCEPT